ncbi:hypothetical protein VTO42DRAFT_3991 [Malbranchea cinnamomea]
MDSSHYYQRQCGAIRVRNTLLAIKKAVCHRPGRVKLSPASPARSTPISNLPPELLMEIVDYLSPVSQACLALTCRTFYHLLQHALRCHHLRHLPDVARTRRLSVRQECLNSQRWEFIRRLETDHWLACSSCLKLHPFTEFRPNQILFRNHRDRVCHLGYYSGFVDLCPCVKLTFRDKRRISEELKRSARAGSGAVKRHWHRCTWKYDNGVVFEAVISTRLAPSRDLIMEMEYIVKWKGQYAFFLEDMHRHICPHSSIYEFLVLALGRPVFHFHSPKMFQTSFSCVICQTDAPLLYHQRKRGVNTLHYVITRNLGHAEDVPDAAWYTQTSFSEDDFYKDCWSSTRREIEVNPSLSNWESPSMVKRRRRWESPANPASRSK